MKLENIKLKLGDILTFDDGFVDSAHIDEQTNNLCVPKKDKLVKIERYKQISGNGILGILYNLETIWERKEEPTNDDIEEIKDKLPLLIHQRCYAEIGKNHKIELMGVFEIYQLKINQIQDKLNEVIRKTNEMGKSE